MSLKSIPRRGWMALILAALISCGGEPANGAGAPPPPDVGIVTVEARPLSITSELPGRVEASRVAEVRARATGIVLKREFREGSDVSEGDVLFRIDPAPMKAAHDSAKAALARAEANFAQTKIRADRLAPLAETHAVSALENEDAIAAREAASAEVAVARAALETARLNLQYATVTAPISGRIGRALVTEGALVSQAQATPMATIQQLDPIYVNLVQSSSELRELQRALSSGQLQGVEDGPSVTILSEDGVEHPQPGTLLFTDITVDETTGTLTLRAEVPNPDRTLLPGMYVRARLPQAVDQDAIAIPQQALLRNAQGASVLVVGADGLVEPRPVEVGPAHGDSWIIQSGLSPGEKVIVDGIQRARPGAAVNPVPWTGVEG